MGLTKERTEGNNKAYQECQADKHDVSDEVSRSGELRACLALFAILVQIERIQDHIELSSSDHEAGG